MPRVRRNFSNNKNDVKIKKENNNNKKSLPKIQGFPKQKITIFINKIEALKYQKCLNQLLLKNVIKNSVRIDRIHFGMEEKNVLENL